MGTRYSKKQFDGSVEYYDSREEMEAANPTASVKEILADVSRSFNPLFAIVGFVVGGIAALLSFLYLGEWPTWAKFISVFAAASATGYIAGKIGNILFLLFLVTIFVGIFVGVGALIWHLLSI